MGGHNCLDEGVSATPTISRGGMISGRWGLREVYNEGLTGSRVWNILYRHNQVGLRCVVNLDSVYHNLRDIVEFCKSINANDLVVWLDWDLKLYDMAKTVFAIMRVIISPGPDVFPVGR